ncbi:hypothetical protein [Cellulomonas sp. URHD0024]|uniref:hypothetical protein n=1 Tax=Cellulomonas sp. URHD0024 TaxID=1302620 RepID=UPI0003F579F9|nr:hypothetical protein [Cellulomonas sp. URHD0024]
MDRAFLRLVRALALALAGVLALTGLSATAAMAGDGAASISGHVDLPGDVGWSAVSASWWQDDVSGWTYDSSAGIEPSGDFVLQGLDEGREYRLEVTSSRTVRGYYAGPGAQLALVSDGAEVVTAPAAGLTMLTRESATISGQIALPDWNQRSWADDIMYASWVDAVPLEVTLPKPLRTWLAEDGTFQVDGLVSGALYRLEFGDGLGVLGGSFDGDGQALARDHSAYVPVPAPSVGLTAEPGRWATISGSVELPEDYVYDEAAPISLEVLHHVPNSIVWLPTGSASVAADGTFAFDRLAPGESYSLRISDPMLTHVGFAQGWVSATGLTQEGSRILDFVAPTDGVIVHPVADDDRGGVQGVAISGSVVLPSGVDASSINVQAYRWSETSHYWVWAGAAMALQDGTGRASFAIHGLDAAVSYRLEVQGNDSLLEGWWIGDDQPLVAQADVARPITGARAGVQLRPRSAATVSGTVHAPAGGVIRGRDGISITAYRASTSYGMTHWTYARSGWFFNSADADSDHVDFALGGLDPEQTYRIEVRDTSGTFAGGYYAGGDLTVMHAEDGTDIHAPRANLNLTLRPAVTISGTILLPDGYVPATMQVTVREPSEWGGWTSSRYVSVGKSADGSYPFSVGGLDPGAPYRLDFSELDGDLLAGSFSANGAKLASTVESGTSIVGGRSGVVLRPERGQTISGTLSLPTGYVRPQAFGPTVTAYGDNGYGSSPVSVVDGSYVIRRLRPGTYSLAFADGSGGFLDGTYTGQERPLAWSGDGTSVASGSTGLRAVAQRSSALAGSLTRPPGHEGDDWGADGIVSIVDAASGGYVTSTWAQSDFGGSADGSFRIGEVPAGSFKIGFNRESGSSLYAGTFYTARATDGPVRFADADAVNVAAGEAVEGIDGRLVTCATVSGTVAPGLVPDGAYAQVTVYNDADTSLVTRSASPEDGAYTVTGLLDGSYRVALGYWGDDGYVKVSEREVVVPGCQEVTGVDLLDMPSVTNVAKPTIAGTPQVGKVLTVAAGTWSPSTVSVTYQWLRDGDPVAGATTPSYALTAADLHAHVSVEVTASKTGYLDASATSAPTEVVAAGTITSSVKPLVTGSAKVGSRLTATAGIWTPSETKPTYQWLRAGVAISGATASAYTLTAPDVGKQVAVKVTVSRDGYLEASATSAPTDVVAAGTISSSVKPVVSGTAKVGVQLTASAGTWTQSGTTATYKWLRAGVAITSATASTYTPTASDLGKALAVTVTAAKDGYGAAAATSEPTAAVVAGSFARTVNPVVTGTAKVGVKLTASAGTWSPTGSTVAYQWLRAGVAITGATATSYVPTASDLGRTLAVKVTVARSGYTSAAATSVSTAKVSSGTITSSVKPTVTGTAKVGQTLTTSAGTWSPTGPTLTYQWLRGGAPISGATGRSYVLTSASKGASVSVKVTATKVGYTTASVTTAAVKVS